MDTRFYLKTVYHNSILRDSDCLTIMEETEEGFMDWLETISGDFHFTAEIVDVVFDTRVSDQAIYIVYDNQNDAFAHKMRWHNPNRRPPVRRW